jgi:hypothetical protein
MSWVFYFEPEFKAPFRSNDIEECCELACEYFSLILDDFIEEIPEHRQPVEINDWLAEDHSLAEKIRLIFPNGFGEDDEEKNHNPCVWPNLIELSNAVRNGTTVKFTKALREAWKDHKFGGIITNELQFLHEAFLWYTSYLQLFVVLSDTNSTNLDFKYPPEDVGGNLIGSIFRKPDATSKSNSLPDIRCA